MPHHQMKRFAAIGLVTACWFAGLVAGATAGELAATGGSGTASGSGAPAARSVVGHSVRGRPIVAVHRGAPNAALKVLVVGCIHGDETTGIPIARRLIAAPPPRNVELWVVPSLNPDGVAADTRGNANGVDLNRNFPFDWMHLGGGEYSGTHALSEPESRAAERLIQRVQPDVTIWFHQPFGLIDRSGGSSLVERRYSRLVGLPLVRLTRYPGSATGWQNHTFPGTTAFVTELPSTVSPALTARATAAVRTLAAELASPELGGAAGAAYRRSRLDRPQLAGRTDDALGTGDDELLEVGALRDRGVEGAQAPDGSFEGEEG
jgi:protein MpaA